MIDRCNNPRSSSYAPYGGRGIRVAVEFMSFETFLGAIGPRPSSSHSLDRIDNDRGYEPGNVRWATRATQQNNRRACRYLDVDGVRRTVTEWAAVHGVPRHAIYSRLERGWPAERAVKEPTACRV
jgi:hypothetical protein